MDPNNSVIKRSRSISFPVFSHWPFNGGSPFVALLCLCVCGFIWCLFFPSLFLISLSLSLFWCIGITVPLRKQAYSINIEKYKINFTTKNWKISDKNSHIFHISAQNIDCGYSLEPPRHTKSLNKTKTSFVIKWCPRCNHGQAHYILFEFTTGAVSPYHPE